MQEIRGKIAADNALIIRRALELALVMGLDVSRIWFQEPGASGDMATHVLIISAGEKRPGC